ncbi:hypothetical protein D3C87_57640 [compost metagenome]
MKKFYCIELEFKVPFASNAKFHSHLYYEEDQIAIRVLLKDEPEFARNFMIWYGKSNDSDKLSDFTIPKVFENQKELMLISFQHSKIISITSNQTDENENEYFTILLDQITLHKSPTNIEKEFGKIYLNKDGFDLVKEFYSIFTGFKNDGKVDIGRMRGMSGFYKIGNVKFRPEFEFSVSDSKNQISPKIEKIPILKFYFPQETKDEDIENSFSIACKICSFYLGNNIEFDRGLICRKSHRVIIKKILQTKFTLKVSSLNWLLTVQGINGFLKLNWQKGYIQNQDKLNEAITNYTHSRLLDTNSKFMLLYNIIEICMGGNKIIEEKFTSVVTRKKKISIYREAFKIIKQTVAEEDYYDFEKKWDTVKQKLVHKPMKSPLIQFLEANRININNMETSINEMKKLRDSIFHGSVDPATTEQIKKSNQQLYSITSILILNLLGVKQWEQRA